MAADYYGQITRDVIRDESRVYNAAVKRSRAPHGVYTHRRGGSSARIFKSGRRDDGYIFLFY